MSDYNVASPPARTGAKFKYILILVLVAFVGGGAATWWLADEYGYLGTKTDAPISVTSTDSAAPANIPSVLPPADTVANIENRMSQINADAAAASGNAARAEGLLVAFATRRAIDSGSPLGYLGDQLRIRFGSTQPQAVATILSSAQTPVTLEALQAELTALESALLTGDRNAGIWATISKEFSELFVLRKDGAPSPAPTQRMLRAHTLVESGNIDGAIAEVSAMPGADAAQSWLAKAQRYIQARKALDMLERTALVAPPPVVLPPPIIPTEESAIVPAQ